MRISELYSIFKLYPKICTNSREITPNCIFFALRGQKFNGNKFAEDAIKKGAAYAVIDQKVYKKMLMTAFPDLFNFGLSNLSGNKLSSSSILVNATKLRLKSERFLNKLYPMFKEKSVNYLFRNNKSIKKTT